MPAALRKAVREPGRSPAPDFARRRSGDRGVAVDEDRVLRREHRLHDRAVGRPANIVVDAHRRSLLLSPLVHHARDGRKGLSYYQALSSIPCFPVSTCQKTLLSVYQQKYAVYYTTNNSYVKLFFGNKNHQSIYL
jgi:hypothetical protein